LAENLRETLGVAKEKPDLLMIEGTDDVIEEIGRTSLKIASLIREYTGLRFAGKSVASLVNLILFNGRCFVGRVMKYQISSDMQSRIAECQKSCDELKVKFDRRMNMDTNCQLKIIKDGQLGMNEFKFQLIIENDRSFILYS
jgi:hypothetical protein